MKNKLFYTYVLLFATLFLTSCEQEILKTSFGMGEEVKLTLRLSSDELKSRAEAGDDNYNENAITKVDLYLYPTGGAGKALHKVSDTFSGKTEVQLTATLSNDLVDDLFDANGKCHAYALVNYPGTAPDANTDASIIANLKAMDITATFNNATGIQTSFVMDGETKEIEYNASTLTVKGEVQVNRAASKIALFVTGVDKTVTDDAGNVWEPDYTAMDISFHNGVNKAKVDVGYTEGRPNNPNTTDNYYDTSGIRDITAELDKTKTTELIFALNTTHIPFYSYSSDWGRTENPDTEPTITLMVPWRKVRNYGDQTDIPVADRKWQTCYYQIPINVKSTGNSLTNCLERNMYYKIMFHVGILGDFNPPTPTIVNASYYTVPWEAEDVDVNVKNYKYLVVDKNDVTVYNENEVRIGYASSDAITAEITYIRRPDYAKTVERVDSTTYYGSLSTSTGTTSVSQGTNSLLRTCSVAVEGNEIVLSHDLVNQSNTSGTNYDFVPYYIWIKVTMDVIVNGEKKTFTEWIRYEQYPAIYVKGDKNSTYISSNNRGNGNVYINDKTSANSEWYSVNQVNTSGSSSSPYMYVMTVTSLSDSNYIIDDTRSSIVDLLSFNGWVTAPSTNNGNRKLKDYYPTQGEGSENKISPQFRICSGYGRLGNATVDLDEAKLRCASYQEDGYPAGRWRVPTAAELQFIGKLCVEGKIPSLFTEDRTYWASSGAYLYDNGTFEATRTADRVRCVYDDWYWSGKRVQSAINDFTWGDEPRN